MNSSLGGRRAHCVLATLACIVSVNAQVFFQGKPLNTSETSIALVRAGDFDHDGIPDLLALGTGSASTGDPLLLGDGFGGFREIGKLPHAFPGPARDAAIGDFDGDGWLDVAVLHPGPASGSELKLFLGSATGFVDASSTHLPTPPSLSTNPSHVIRADYDGDGDLDLVLFHPPAPADLVTNDGAGRFTYAGYGPSLGYVSARAADFDADGNTDLFLFGSLQIDVGLQQANHSLVWSFVSNGTIVVNGTPQTVTAAAVVDFDGDGAPDIVLARKPLLGPSTVGLLQVFRNDGHGRFTLPSIVLPMPTGVNSASDLQVADLDRDGRPDLILTGLDPAQRPVTGILGNRGAGTFVLVGALMLGVCAPEIMDIEGDGDPDWWLQLPTGGLVPMVNAHSAEDAPLPPRLGRSWPVTIYDRPGYGSTWSLAVPLLAAGPRPTGIPGLGLLMLDPGSVVQLQPLFVPPGTPVTFSLDVPNLPPLVGQKVYAQSLLVPPNAPVRITNAIVATVGT